MKQRALEPGLTDAMKSAERKADRALVRELRRQPVYPWLETLPGLRGVHVATLVAIIGDARRFPGARCSAPEAHTRAPAPVGSPCPATGLEHEPCTGTMLEPRPGTGVRSLWHYLGLHVVDGRLPRRMKGRQVDWNPAGRTACLQPLGIAEQIVVGRVEPYRSVYDAAKARLTAERGALDTEDRVDSPSVVDETCGSVLPQLHQETAVEAPPVIVAGAGRRLRRTHEEPTADRRAAIEMLDGRRLRPIDVERIARTIAVKRFVGDLLTAMKAASG